MTMLSRQERRAADKLKRTSKRPYSGANADIAARFQAAVNLHRTGRLAEAEAAYRAVLAQEPDHPHALNVLGILCCETGRALAGRDLLRQAIEINGGLAEYHANLSEAAWQSGDAAEALEAALHAVKVDRRSARSHLALANAYRNLGQGTFAIAAYRQALECAPDSYEAQAGYAACCSEFGLSELTPADEALLARALTDGWTRSNKLVQGIVPALKRDPRIASLLEAAAAPDGDARIAGALAEGRVAAALARPLVMKSMQCAPIADPSIERFFLCLRRACLAAASTGPALAADELEVLAALAEMSFLCDYALPESEGERLAVDRLRTLVEVGGDDRPDRIAALAAYRPLARIASPERFAEAELPVRLDGLLRLQVHEPAADLRRIESIPRLTPIAAGTSAEVRAMYEESPYPRWAGVNMRPSAVPLRTYLRRMFGNLPLPDAGDILVAGCGTGQESIELAMKCRSGGERILAVDLSLPSLAYAIRRSEALNLTNIRYAQADITLLDRLDERFAMITSNGVLHHLADPIHGWRTLAGLLRPRGLMQISLYSEIGRRAIVAAREMIAARGWTSTPEDMRAAREAILGLPAEHPARSVSEMVDFYSLNMCRDLLFHVQEHRFTLPALAETIDGLGLRFLGFETHRSTRTRYSLRFPDDPSLTSLRNWDIFEHENPDTFGSMYQFWVEAQ